MSYHNIHSSPEAYGLEVFADLEDPHACYSFDTIVVWRDKETGALYWASDAGCSCPSPFEDYDRTNITRLHTGETFQAFEAEVLGHGANSDPAHNCSKVELLARVLGYLLRQENK